MKGRKNRCMNSGDVNILIGHIKATELHLREFTRRYYVPHELKDEVVLLRRACSTTEIAYSDEQSTEADD